MHRSPFHPLPVRGIIVLPCLYLEKALRHPTALHNHAELQKWSSRRGNDRLRPCTLDVPITNRMGPNRYQVVPYPHSLEVLHHPRHLHPRLAALVIPHAFTSSFVTVRTYSSKKGPCCAFRRLVFLVRSQELRLHQYTVLTKAVVVPRTPSERWPKPSSSVDLRAMSEFRKS